MVVLSARRLDLDECGTVSVIFALFVTIAIGACAIAVDIGSLYLERRTIQGAADLAAIAAAGDMSRAEEAARATLAANGFGDVSVFTVTRGHYVADKALAPAQRFVAAMMPFDAVRVDVGKPGRLFFGASLMSGPSITVAATSVATAQATFSIGSQLAALRGGVANAVLGGLLGGSINLSLMDYSALASARVTMQSFLDALASGLHVTAGTYGDLLQSNVTVGDVLSATINATNATGASAAVSALRSVLSWSDRSVPLPASTLVDLGPLANVALGQPSTGLRGEVDALSIVRALATAANDRHQVAVNLQSAVPGLLGLTLNIAVGEPPQSSGWVAVGEQGAALRTAQTRIKLIAETGGTGVLAGTRVRLPVYIELASASATLTSVACASGRSSATAKIDAKPAVARAWIGDVSVSAMSSFGSSVPVSAGDILQTPLVSATGSAYVEMSNTSATTLSFAQSDIDSHAIKTVETRDYTSTLIASLLGRIDLRVSVSVSVIGLGLGSPSALQSLVLTILTPVATTLDGTLSPLMQALGVHVGAVDVSVQGIACGTGVLAG